MAASEFAPATGSTAYVSKAGDTMTGTLNLPANGLVAGINQLVLAGGNVGIGTAAPGDFLDVNVGNPGPSEGGITIRGTTSSGVARSWSVIRQPTDGLSAERPPRNLLRPSENLF